MCIKTLTLAIHIDGFFLAAVPQCGGGNSLTHEMRLGIDWRPLLASLRLHFGVATCIGLLRIPHQELPRESIWLVQVTLQSPSPAVKFVRAFQ